MGVVTVPAIGTLIGRVTGGPPAAHLPLEVLLGQLLATVVIPVSLGIVLRQRWPRFADDYQPGMQRAGFGLLALLLVMIVLADVRSFVSALSDAVPLAGAFVACAAAVGGGCGHVLGGDLRERVTLAIEFATRNVAVATILAVTAGRIEFATFATTYFLTELSLMTAAAIAFRRVVARSRAVAARIAR
jgi:BASS family bile acid:Na+ symporter